MCKMCILVWKWHCSAGTKDGMGEQIYMKVDWVCNATKYKGATDLSAPSLRNPIGGGGQATHHIIN